MIELTDLQEKALSLLRTRTVRNPMTGKHIALSIGLKDRDSGKEGADMRAIIHALRKKNYPICANGKGYFYASNTRELRTYIESLQGRVNSEQEAIFGLKGAYDKVGAAPLF